ncbi:protein BUD31-like protein 2 [Gossypium australe]|uniref:Protein BUD31-like protein 2 n=1 Tax=Gossypium australe TaxID=47621 RepID=A0A5B6VJ80_9ROSI|nr:protein BUD31-like protein 2 [Gossypium australe]
MSVAHAGVFNETSPGLCGLIAAWVSSPSHNKGRKARLPVVSHLIVYVKTFSQRSCRTSEKASKGVGSSGILKERNGVIKWTPSQHRINQEIHRFGKAFSMENTYAIKDSNYSSRHRMSNQSWRNLWTLIVPFSLKFLLAKINTLCLPTKANVARHSDPQLHLLQ